MPLEKHVANVFRNAMRNNVLDSNPFVALTLFAEKHSGKGVFWYRQHDEKSEGSDSPLAVGMTRAAGLLLAILYSGRSHCWMDSTYRYMNENRAPVTLVGTVDGTGHLQPSGCACVMTSAIVD